MFTKNNMLGTSLLSLSTLLLSINPAAANNPIVQDIYTADPAPLVYNDRFYIFTGHDEDNSTSFNMLDWRLFSSTDMANWQHHPSPMSLDTFSWVSAQAWAGQVIPRNEKFYFYVPVRNADTDKMAIGVGVSDSVEGPYEDAIGAPLLENNEIDPTVFIDDDGQAYLFWGNPNLWYVKLNEDMVSYSGEMTQVNLTVDGFGTRPDDTEERPSAFEEAPWLYKRDGLYYMVYAGASCCPENIQYSTAPSATGPWTYGGVVMESEGASDTNHPGIVDYANGSYFVYHNGALPGGSSFTRSVAVEGFEYNEDGSIPVLQMTTDGPAQVGTLDPYARQEAETMAWSEGIETEDCSEGGLDVCEINNGDYIKVRGVAFGDGAESFSASVASATDGGNIELRLDSDDGQLVGTCTVAGTGGWQEWKTVSCPVSEATGTHDLFFKFVGEGDDFLFTFDWWQFK